MFVIFGKNLMDIFDILICVCFVIMWMLLCVDRLMLLFSIRLFMRVM